MLNKINAYNLLNQATLIYHQCALSGQHEDFNLFVKNRKINKEIIDGYRIGYANNQNLITNWILSIPDAEEQKITMELAVEIGLVKNSRILGIGDTFKYRVMFPVINQDGQVIGFSSRALNFEYRPVFLNSIDSFIFNKSEIFFGMNLADFGIQLNDAVIIVEGVMDQISLHKNGFGNTVALMGTNLSPKAIECLIGSTKNIFLAFDSDKAGLAITERVNAQLARAGVIAYYVELSPHKDPDEFLRVHGANAFFPVLDNAIPFFDYLLDRIVPEILPEGLDQKLDLLNMAFEIFASLGTNLEATKRVIIFARTIGLKSEPEQVLNAYKQYLESRSE